ncbi:sugar transferase [Gryllotalpicola ginsengisoli]|uniref:sugar transferase n=1 Tax=Gryllotalpicola ginsengisoli TaxID=444608 RepID=UPI0003B402FC|nr:sugar transferase [Gryllotalpicola ginsengisoli]
MAENTAIGVKHIAPTRNEADWRKAYAFRLMITDALAIVWVVFGTQLVWLGFDRAASTSSHTVGEVFGLDAINYTVISASICILWLAALSFYGTRADRVIGVGAQEYRLVFSASWHVFGLIAIVAFLFKLDLARGYILLALPLGVLVLFASRWMWRQWLAVQRMSGKYASRCLLVGSESSVSRIAAALRNHPDAGYVFVGAIVPGRSGTLTLADGASLQLVGSLDDVASAMDESGADTVVITGSPELTPERVRRISWTLEEGRRHLVVDPGLTDIGGPRIHTRPVAGLPLMHVETPRYEGPERVTKRVFDVVGSALLIILLSPLFAAVAIAIKTTSPGPVFYRQERVGRDGRPIHMLKFRSMVVDADAQLPELLKAEGAGDKPLFKVRNDPRITPIGRFIRKYSIDELPQLFNVIRGDMSLVGPRPQRQGEVELYDDAAWRRLNVLPGMTGLWQVSGRSNLSWEEAIRLDLYYVENWSLVGDLVILWRTARAVLMPGDGAI